MKGHYITAKDDLFDPQLVRCVWDDELEGKQCFVADYLDGLRDAVNNSEDEKLHDLNNGSAVTNYPFNTDDGYYFRYAYYDPYYEVKLKFLDGAQIQYINKHLENDVWHDCDAPCWDTDIYGFRVKPEPKPAWRPFETVGEMLSKLEDSECGKHCIWLAMKQYPETELLVTGLDYEDNTVQVEGTWYTMQDLLDRFWVEDGPVGVKEGEE